MTGKTGNFAIFKNAARFFDIAQCCVIPRFAGWRIWVHERMTISVEAVIAKTGSNTLPRGAGMACEALLHGQHPGRLGTMAWIVPAKTQHGGAGGNHDKKQSQVFLANITQYQPPTRYYLQAPSCQTTTEYQALLPLPLLFKIILLQVMTLMP